MTPAENFETSYNFLESELFKSYPPIVRESIVQSGAVICNDEELKAVAEGLTED